MKILSILIFAFFISANCSRNVQSASQSESMKFAGSTPCDSAIKSIIGIPLKDSIDFMRWELTLEDIEKSFVLSIRYGLAKANTNDFVNGGKTMTIKGEYENKYEKSENFKGEICHLISSSFSSDTLSLVKLSNRIMHMLQHDNSLMVGNGGYSYILNLIDQPDDGMFPLITIAAAEKILNDTSTQIIFDGRTPCRDIAMEFDFNSFPDCMKLKWRLILNRDPVTLKPTKYQLQRSDIRNTGEITGKWTVFCHTDSTIIISLDPDKPDNSISLLAGDENVLFFLDKDYRLFSGNSDFSYALNRKNPI